MCGEKTVGQTLRSANTYKEGYSPAQNFVQETPQQPSMIEGLQKMQQQALKRATELGEAIEILKNHSPELEVLYRKLYSVGAY